MKSWLLLAVKVNFAHRSAGAAMALGASDSYTIVDNAMLGELLFGEKERTVSARFDRRVRS
jgi:hypothetical protein